MGERAEVLVNAASALRGGGVTFVLEHTDDYQTPLVLVGRGVL
jgi:hypothetical protein